MKVTMKIVSFGLVAMPFLVTLSLVVYFRSPLVDGSVRVCAEAKARDRRDFAMGGEDGLSQQTGMSEEKLPSSLFTPGIDEKSCLSRFESSRYRKNPPRKPSSYLLSKLRAYEELHRRCGPNTEHYNKTVEQLKSGHSDGSNECNYVVWISSSGLGNRILTVTSAFLYALLTDRVLLVELGNDMSDLFCEPFPGTSWSLPHDFPLRDQFDQMNKKYHQSYGNILKNGKASNTLIAHMYLHLNDDYSALDKLFFCDDYQTHMHKVPWLLVKSNNYFVPSFFLMPSFDQELTRLFPEKSTVFHHLGRYLFSPSNLVWDIVKRYYQAYLAKADEIIGIQIRTFEPGHGPFPHVMDQILACTAKEDLLPKVVDSEQGYGMPNISQTTPKLKAVLVTSLSSSYFENLKSLYWQNPTLTGDIVGLYQPSHEELQQTGKQSHNSKAWAEMYLLTLTDVLVTSGWSTFGYVAQGLAGLRPWILPRAVDRIVPDPPCVRVGSIEPCFHSAPTYDCKAKKDVDTGALVPHVRHCEDMSVGLKVV